MCPSIRDDVNGFRTDDHTYRAAFHLHPVPVALSTKIEGRFVEISDSFTEIVGFSRNEVLGKTSLELGLFVDPDYREHLAGAAVGSERVRNVQLQVRTKGGEIRTGLFSLDPIDIDGRAYFLTTFTDITDRLLAEQARQASDDRYRLVSELTSDYAYSFRVVDGPELVLDWFSGTIETLTGFTLDEIQEMGGWEKLIHPEDLEIPRRQLAELLAGRTDTVEYRIVSRANEIRWVHDYARPEFDVATGKLTHIHGAVQDTTERHLEVERRLQLEAQVQQTQKLESLGVLAGGIAHDFNNLLMTIVGNVDLAGKDLPGDSPAAPSIREIRHAAERASELVHQMLVYAGKGRSTYEAVDLQELTQEMAGLLQVSISKKVQITFEFADDLPAIAADPVQIRQVFMNLVTNASEAVGDENGTIAVRVGREFIENPVAAGALPSQDAAAGPYAFFEVSDDGVGMDVATSAKIFEPFFSTKFEGRGLGLAAVQGIVRGHAGWITVRSAKGMGTTLRVYLPAPGASVVTTVAATATAIRRLDDRTILLVDDEDTVRDVSRRMLERLGARVVTARDGEEALATLAAADFLIDAVLLDLTMPRLSGDECMPELRRLRPDLPVVFASGFGQQDLVEKCGAWAQTAFIAKPFNLEQLAAKIARVLD